MMHIAVTQQVNIDNRSTRYDALDHRIGQWLWQIGCIALPVPNAPEYINTWWTECRPQGILLSGGNDLNEYGGLAKERDDTERQLLTLSTRSSVPVIGICRGLQMLVHFSGGTLRRIDGHVAKRHSVSGNITSEVNSYHQWAIDRVPDCYSVLAIASDGSVEALEHRTLPWQGWMWHPEREDPFVNDDLLRAQKLFIKD